MTAAALICRSPSWIAFGAVDGDGDRPAAADIDAVEPLPLGVAQAERLGALRERALLARLNEREPAAAAVEEIGSAGAGEGMPHLGAGQGGPARLLVAGGCDLRIVAARRVADVFRQVVRRKQPRDLRKRRAEQRP